MDMFKQVATEHLEVLFFIFLLGNGLHAVPPNPSANACGSHFYTQLLTKHYHLVVGIFVSAMLLLAVRMAISIAEANAIVAARAAARRAPEAVAMGLAAVPAGWKRRSVRAMLFLAVYISIVASNLAMLALEDGYLYRTGCQHGYGIGTVVVNCILICLMAVVNLFSSKVAMFHNKSMCWLGTSPSC